MSNLETILKSKGIQKLEDSAAYRHRMEIIGSKGNPYVVAQRVSDNVWTCGCFGYRRYRNCKHLKSMMPFLKQLKAPKQLLLAGKTKKVKKAAKKKVLKKKKG